MRALVDITEGSRTGKVSVPITTRTNLENKASAAPRLRANMVWNISELRLGNEKPPVTGVTGGFLH